VIEADCGRLKPRLRPMAGLKRLAFARMTSAEHALVQNLRRGRFELTTDLHPHDRIRVAFNKRGPCL